MRFRVFFSLSACALLASCGGGDDGGTPPVAGPDPSPSPTPSPPPTLDLPTLAVDLSDTAADVAIEEGGKAQFGFAATYSGSSDHAIVPDVTINARRYRLASAPGLNGTTYMVALETVPQPAGGETSSTVTFRLCTSSDCTQVYPGSEKTFAVNLDVRLKDWQTVQRDAAHTGYVAASYDSADFSQAWSQPAAGSAQWTQAVGTVGAVFASRWDSATKVRRSVAFRTADGSTLWEARLPDDAEGPGHPFYAAGQVGSTPANSTGSGRLSAPMYDLATGRKRGALSYIQPLGPYNSGAPVPFGTDLYFQADNLITRQRLGSNTYSWTEILSLGYLFSGTGTPAVDEDRMYYFARGHLLLVDKSTGKAAKRLDNGAGQICCFSSPMVVNHASPVLDGRGHVFAHSAYPGSSLAAYDLQRMRAGWSLPGGYATDFAYNDGRIYAYDSTNGALQIIDAEAGSVLERVDLGDRLIVTSNIVLTETHIFLSGHDASPAKKPLTVALDLTKPGKPVAWSTPVSGYLALMPDNYLIITGTRITAIRLF